MSEPEQTQPEKAKDLGALKLHFLFTKLNVADMAAMVTFYERAFGFGVTMTIDNDEIEETMLSIPGERFVLVLVRHKDGRSITLGDAHGPIGLSTVDVDAAAAHALACGATMVSEPTDAEGGGGRYSFVADPEGHEIELIRFG